MHSLMTPRKNLPCSSLPVFSSNPWCSFAHRCVTAVTWYHLQCLYFVCTFLYLHIHGHQSYWTILMTSFHLITSAKILFLNKVTFPVLGLMTSMCLFWEDKLTSLSCKGVTTWRYVYITFRWRVFWEVFPEKSWRKEKHPRQTGQQRQEDLKTEDTATLRIWLCHRLDGRCYMNTPISLSPYSISLTHGLYYPVLIKYDMETGRDCPTVRHSVAPQWRQGPIPAPCV